MIVVSADRKTIETQAADSERVIKAEKSDQTRSDQSRADCNLSNVPGMR